MTTEIEKQKKNAQLVYILYALSFIVGITYVAGVIVAYIKRPESKDTWLESHYTWQIKTFWYSLIGMVIGIILMVVFIGFFIMFAVAVWTIYRIVKGWLALNDEKPLGV